MTDTPEAGKMTPSDQAAKLTAQQIAAKILLDWNEAIPAADNANPIPHQAVMRLVVLIEAALIASYRLGQEDMRERAAREVDCGCEGRTAVLAATTKAERRRACPLDPCGAQLAKETRALPLEDSK